MANKRLVLHYNRLKEILQKEPKRLTQVFEIMSKEFGLTYTYVRREIEELITLKKIKKVKHNNDMLLLWTEEPVKFEYELSNNIVKLDKQFIEFITYPSKVRQMMLPGFILAELSKKIVGLDSKLELMLELKAIKSDGVWYKIERS